MKDSQISLTGFLVWITCALFFLYEFLLRTVLGTFQHAIMHDLEITTFKFSILSSTSYLVIYGLMQIPVGIIVDRYGLKKTLFFAVLVCSTSTFGFALFNNYSYSVIFRILTGFGSSFGFVCLLVSVYQWFPQNKAAFFIGLSQFIGTLGPMIAAGPLDSISNSDTVSWHTVMLYLSFIGFVIALLVLAFVKNNYSRKGKYIILYKKENIKSYFSNLFRGSQPIAIAFFCGIVYFFLEYLSENEGKHFIELKGYSQSFASYLITLSWVGYALGCPTLGFISDYFQKRKSLLILASFLMFFGILFSVFFINKYLLILGIFFIGFGASGISIGFVLMAENISSRYTAVALGFNNAFITAFSSILTPVLGYFLELKSVNDKISLADYTSVFGSLLIFVAFSIILAIFFIKESFAKSRTELTILKV